MRPSSILRALPPVVPPSELRKTFEGQAFSVVNRLRAGTKNQSCRRTQPIDERLADEYVQSFGIEPGMGYITRALLRLPPSHVASVLAIEPSLGFLTKGLGFPAECRKSWRAAGHEKPTDSEGIRPDATALTWHVHQDPDEKRLRVADYTIYQWDAVESLAKAGYFDMIQKAKWDEGTPNIHLVVQVPDAILGEQLVSQWLSCIPTRSWLFQYGRMKMSLIVTPHLYDRLTAEPKDRSYCKLSVIRKAVASYTPSHPGYPRQPKVAGFLQQEIKEWKKAVKSAKKAGLPPPPEPKAEPQPVLQGNPDSRLLSLDPSLYYPPVRGKKVESAANFPQPDRPPMVGITLEPLRNSKLSGEDKEIWDYVLRKLFVVSSNTLEGALKNLGPGGGNLFPQLAGDHLEPSQRIDVTKKIKEYDVEDWAKIVAVFKDWKFAPQVLTLSGFDPDRNEHSSRVTMGVSL